MTYDPVVQQPAADLASRIVWFDAFVTNVDRTVAQHEHADVAPRPVADRSWRDAVLPPLAGLGVGAGRARAPFPAIKDHVLLRRASLLQRGGRGAGAAP